MKITIKQKAVAIFPWLALSNVLSQSLAISDFRPLFTNLQVFENALAKEAETTALPKGEVTGLTVPHHILAVDLVARAFRLSALGDYQRVVVLFPDHFQQSKDPFNITTRNFQTIYGCVETDVEAVNALRGSVPRIVDSDLFASDHGIHLILPFIAKFFPTAKLVPISLNISSKLEEWDQIAAALIPLFNNRTLIVQSTDFSHYLTRSRARDHDQQTLNAIATGNPASIRSLSQPAHLDSKAAQHVQMVLQREVIGATPEVIESRNSFEYLEWEGSPTTSYIIQIYRRPSVLPCPIPAFPGQEIFYFAGDTNFGRYLDRPLRNEAVADTVRDRILRLTGGAPLIVNLEGVMLEEGVPRNLPALRIAMDCDQSIRWLKALNVVAVSLANNHTLDFGGRALAIMKHRLQSAGIVALEHGEFNDFGSFRLLALRDLDNHGENHSSLIDDETLASVRKMRLPRPTIAFMHWGREYAAAPTPREIFLARELYRAGLPFTIGAHPHVASTEVSVFSGARAASIYSLGNFLFDQPGSDVSGAIAEVRIFRQGTCFLRVRQIGNIYQDQVLSRPREMNVESSDK